MSVKKRLEALENQEVEEIEDLREYYKELYGEEETDTGEQDN